MRILGWVILRDRGSYPPAALPRESRAELTAARIELWVLDERLGRERRAVRRLREALEKIDAYEDEGDWYLKGILDVARAALAGDNRG